MSNRALGDSFEQRLTSKLAEHGFWVHMLKQNQAGQPADIICVKNNLAALIDCKVCSDGRFDTDRIETNQVGSMTVWQDAHNREWWFAVELFHGEIYMIPGLTAVRWILDHTSSTIYCSEIRSKFLTLERWWERFDAN